MSRKSVKKAYSGSGDNYDQVRGDEGGKLLGDYDISIVTEMVPFITDVNALNIEVGSGTGRFTIPLIKKGFYLTATDINDTLLQSLRNKLATMKQYEGKCIVQVEDGFSLSYGDDEIDGLLCIHVIPRFETNSDQLVLLKEFYRVIVHGGRLLFNFSNKSSLLYGKMYRGHLIAYKDIINELDSLGFEVISKRGKWLANGTLLRSVPFWLKKIILTADRLMQKFWVSRAWDVFILARKK